MRKLVLKESAALNGKQMDKVMGGGNPVIKTDTAKTDSIQNDSTQNAQLLQNGKEALENGLGLAGAIKKKDPVNGALNLTRLIYNIGSIGTILFSWACSHYNGSCGTSPSTWGPIATYK